MTVWETVALVAGAMGVGKIFDTTMEHLLGGRARRMDIAEKAQRIAGEAVDDLEEQRDRARLQRDTAREILTAIISGEIDRTEAGDRARKHGII